MEQMKIIEFLEIVGKLKHLKRRGWELKNIDDCESVAGHMYRMGIMTFLLTDKDNLDKTKCMQMALVHDLAEAIVGDITPNCGVDKVEKHRREDAAMKEITSLLGEKGEYLYNLFNEYEEQNTEEAKFVKDIDRFDMLLQAYEYEKRNKNPNFLQEFFDNTKDCFRTEMIKKLVKELNTQRDQSSS